MALRLILFFFFFFFSSWIIIYIFSPQYSLPFNVCCYRKLRETREMSSKCVGNQKTKKHLTAQSQERKFYFHIFLIYYKPVVSYKPCYKPVDNFQSSLSWIFVNKLWWIPFYCWLRTDSPLPHISGTCWSYSGVLSLTFIAAAEQTSQ